jgi:tagatose-6-phosphate ketose/aldose isomerase
VNALAQLLDLSSSEKSSRGLEFTPREIAQQPDTWPKTFALFEQRRTQIVEFLDAAGIFNEPTHRPTVFVVGAGTSDYIGRALTQILREHWQCEVLAVPSTDIVTHLADLVLPQQKYLWISFSRSGDSPESVAAVEKALAARPDIHHLIVTCNAKAKMVTLTSGNPKVLSVCLDDAVNDRGLAMTSSFSNMVVFAQCLAHVNDPGSYKNVMADLVTAGTSLLAVAPDLAAKLANENYATACFVGSGPLRAVASECALKTLELTSGRTLTMSESALGLRHGPMSALKQDTLLVCFLSSDPSVRRYETDLLREIGEKKLVRTRVVIGAEVEKSLAEHLLAEQSRNPGVALADVYRPACDVIFGQLLGLFLSLRWNLKPDHPSPNGAISRVVQGVKIYA